MYIYIYVYIYICIYIYHNVNLYDSICMYIYIIDVVTPNKQKNLLARSPLCVLTCPPGGPFGAEFRVPVSIDLDM